MATQHDTCQNRWLRSILTIRFELTLATALNSCTPYGYTAGVC